MSVTEESDAVVQLLKKRLREKAKSESDLLQELHSLNSQVGACRSQINSEKQVGQEYPRVEAVLLFDVCVAPIQPLFR